MSKYNYVTPYKNGKPQRTVLMKEGGTAKDLGADFVVPVKKMAPGGNINIMGQKQEPNDMFGASKMFDENTSQVFGVGEENITLGMGKQDNSPTYKELMGGMENMGEDWDERDPNKYKGTDKKPYYNPYSSPDTRQASFLLGQSIKGEASTGTGIAAGAKIGLGLARDITSGMGLANREQFLQEEEDRNMKNAALEQKGAGQLREYKEGGGVSYRDIMKLRKYGLEKMKAGGGADFGKKMTGEHMEGLPENQEDQAVVELEDGEHVLQPDGSMQEVEGDKHSQGGEKLSEEDIQDGSIVISDDTKVGGEIAKYFRSKYEIKLKAKNTFADVVDKVEDKIGVTKVNKELEDLYNKLEKEEKGTEHEPTKELNREYLSEAINEKEQEKSELEEERLELMEDVYIQQEGEKDEEEAEESEIDFDTLKQVAQESGLDELQAQEAVEEFKKGGSYFNIPKMKDGGEKGNLEKINKLIEEDPDKFEEFYEVQTDENGDIVSAKLKDNNTDYAIQDYSGGIEYNAGDVTYGGGELDEVVIKGEGRIQKEVTGENINLEFEGRDFDLEDPNLKDADLTGGKTQEDKRQEMRMPHMPDDWVLPPSSMKPPAKMVTDLGRDEAMHVSPDQALANNQAQVSGAMGAIASLPPAQRAAMMASIQADAMGADGQAISQANQANMQMDAEARRFNIGQADRESAAASQNALSYEDRMFRTEAAYDENIRGFLDYMRKSNTTRFKDVRNQNLVGSLFEDYEINDAGQVVVRKDSKFTGSIDQSGTGSGAQKTAEERRKEQSKKRTKRKR